MTVQFHQRRFLRVLSDASQPLTARQIGEAVFGGQFNARTRSASAAQNMWELIRGNFAERTLLKRELYGYSITEAGRNALKAIDQ